MKNGQYVYGDHSVEGIFLDSKPCLKVSYFIVPIAIKTCAFYKTQLFNRFKVS